MAKAYETSKPQGVFIEDLMEKKGLKKKDIAEMLDTSDATVSRLLNGQRGLDLDWLHRFAKALDVPLWQLFHAPQHDGQTKSPETALRSAMLAFGVDRSQLDRAVQIIATFVPPTATEARSEQSPIDDQSEPANRRHESAPSR